MPRRSPRSTTVKLNPDTVLSTGQSKRQSGRKNARKINVAIKSTDQVPPTKKIRSADKGTLQPAEIVSSFEVVSSDKVKQLRPSHDECRYVVEELGKLHPDVMDDCQNRRTGSLGASCGMQESIADGLVSTILSQNTTSANSTRAFQQLKKALPTWEDVVALPDPPTKLEDAIRCGGLAQIKSKRIHTIFRTLMEERGSPSLEYLRELTNEQVKKELGRFPGLGPKTISCVLLFTMLRPEFPVDTHVHRITKDILKWIAPKASREDAYDHLNAAIPDPFKLELHCLLIAHGRQCHRCAARGKPQFPPKDGTKLPCPLMNICCGLAKQKSKQGVTNNNAPALLMPENVTGVTVKAEKVGSLDQGEQFKVLKPDVVESRKPDISGNVKLESS